MMLGIVERYAHAMRPNNALVSDAEPHPIEWTPRPNARGDSNGGAGGVDVRPQSVANAERRSLMGVSC